MTQLNYYRILRLDSSATPKEISKSYQNLSILYKDRKEPVASEIVELLDEAYAVLHDPARRATYDLESTMKPPSLLLPTEMNEAEKIVSSWERYFTIKEQAYVDKIHAVNKVVRFTISILVLFFIWFVITLRFDIAFLMMFGVLFLRVMLGSIYKIKNPPPPIEISAVE